MSGLTVASMSMFFYVKVAISACLVGKFVQTAMYVPMSNLFESSKLLGFILYYLAYLFTAYPLCYFVNKFINPETTQDRNTIADLWAKLKSEPKYSIPSKLIVYCTLLLTGLKTDYASAKFDMSVVSTFFVMIVYFDMAFYFGHSVMHTPWVYKNLHKAHHYHKYVNMFSIGYKHPIDDLVTKFLFLLPMALGFNNHVFLLIGWTVVGIAWVICDHAKILCNGFHSRHHENTSKNFAVTPTLDFLFGTYIDEDWKEKNK